MNDQLDSLGTNVVELTTKVESLSTRWETELREEREKCAFDVLRSSNTYSPFLPPEMTSSLGYYNEWLKLGYVEDG